MCPRKHLHDAVAIMLKAIHAMDFPYEHWSRLRTNNGLERIMKEIRRRTRVVGSFPDGYSAMMRHISTTKWGTRQYMTTCKLYEGDVR